MKKYRRYQKFNQSKFPKHISPNKRDSNGNIIYYESLDSKGDIIKHYQEFDNLNRKISYNDTKGNSSNISYYGDTKIMKTENEIFIDEGIKASRITNYDKSGMITNKFITSGNIRYYQEFKRPYTKKTTYSPFEKIYQ